MTQSTQHLNQETLSAYVDHELQPGEEQAARQHLDQCHACALRVLSATQLKTATARAGNRFTAPPEALARLTAHLRNEAPTKKAPRILTLRPMAWTALAAAILIAISLLTGRHMQETDTFAAELLDQHLGTLTSGATPQVISTDRHTVKPWFQGRLPFSFNLPDATALPPDTALKGADLTYVHGQPAALLLFAIHKHQVSIFVTQRNEGPAIMTLPDTREGFNLRTATTANLRLAAVSDVNASELDQLVAALVRAQMP